MLSVEKLVCRNTTYHVDCHWRTLKRVYHNKTYFTLKKTLMDYCKVTGTAYQIRNTTTGNVILKLKLGHDNNIFVIENPPHVRTHA